MKILKTSEELITRRAVEVDMEDGSCVVAIDLIQDGKILDTVFRDAATGTELDDMDLIEDLEEFLPPFSESNLAANARESIQENLLALLDGMPQETLDRVCQIVTEGFANKSA